MKKYLLSFTAATVLAIDMRTLAKDYLLSPNWSNVILHVKKDNLLQRRTVSTSSRIASELIVRLQQLDMEELDYLVNSDMESCKMLSWVAICRAYDFIRDFMAEVVREHYLVGTMDVTYTDYATFINMKSAFHPELNTVTETTIKKLRQVLFRMMKEAGIIEPKKRIIPTIMPPSLLNLLPHEDYLCFPMFVREN